MRPRVAARPGPSSISAAWAACMRSKCVFDSHRSHTTSVRFFAVPLQAVQSLAHPSWHLVVRPLQEGLACMRNLRTAAGRYSGDATSARYTVNPAHAVSRWGTDYLHLSSLDIGILSAFRGAGLPLSYIVSVRMLWPLWSSCCGICRQSM